MTLVERIELLTKVIAQDIKVINKSIGNLPNLTTQAKQNLVVAINELKTKLDLLEEASNGNNTNLQDILNRLTAVETSDQNQNTQINQINIKLNGLLNDSLNESAENGWSINKIKFEISKAIAELINGADADSDTLKELADKITALAQADNGLVSATQVQSFNATQKKRARTNIGAIALEDLGNTDVDFVSIYNAAKS